MNSIVKTAKQALSTVVVGATILWSMGASLLVGSLTATAAQVDGSLIKAKEFDSVYYYKAGQRWVFPNLKAYKSWYKDFSTVKVIPRTELESYSIHLPGSNIVYRAGTRLVKITTDPKVYAIEPGGKLRWVKDEATAKALYGNDWAKRVDDVSDAFMTSYNVGADLSGTMLPDGSLVKSGSNWYYIDGGKKRMVSEAAFAGNNFNAAYALSVSDVSAYADGAALGMSDVVDTAQGGSVSSPTSGPVVSGALAISLASDSPSGTQSVVVQNTNGASGVSGQRMSKMVKINFTASASGDAKVTQVTAKRLGVSKDGDVDTLFLADASGKILAKNTSFSGGVATFAGALFTVPAGQTVSVWLTEDVNANASAGSTQGWSVDAAGVKTDGNGAVTGSAMGGLFTVANVTDLGQLEYATSSPTSAATVDAGKVGYTLGTFKFRAMNQELRVTKVKFTQIGTIATTDLQNLKLQVAGVQYDAVKQLNSDNTIWFDFTKDSTGAANVDGGLKILAGQTKFADIVGDIVGGTNRNFKFSVQNQEDVSAWDSNYKVNVPVADWGTDAFAVESLAQTSINTGTLTVTVAADAPNGNIAQNASSITLARFNLTAAGEDMKVTSLSVTSTSSDYTNIFKNVKLMLNGAQVGTTATSLTAGVASAQTFSNNFVVKVGKVSVLEIVADLTDTTVSASGAANETFSFSLVAGGSNAQGLISLANVSTASVSGNTLTLKSGAPTIAKNNAMVDASTVNPTGVIKDTDLKIASFVITAGAGEGAKISSIGLKDNAAALNGLFTRLRVQNAGVNLAPEVGSLSGASSTYTFNFTTPVTLAKGQQYVVDVVADVLSTTSTAQLTDNPNPVIQVLDSTIAFQTLDTAQSGNIAVSGTTGVGQNVFLASKGSLVAAVSADTAVAQQLVMGAVNQPVFKFKLTAGKSEDLNVTELTTAATIMASSTPTGIIKNIRLYDGDTMIGNPVAALITSDASGTNATSTAYAKFSALNLTIAKNTSKTYSVVVDVASSPDIYSGVNLTMHLINSYDTGASSAIVAKGGKSGQTISASGPTTGFLQTTDIKGNVMTVYKTKVTVAHAANAPSGAASKGTDQVVAKFVVSNSANVNNQAATISAMDVSISTSISSAGSQTRVTRIYKTEQLVAANQLVSTSIDSTAANSACLFGSSRNESSSGTTGCPLFFKSAIVGQSPFSPAVTIEAGAAQTFSITQDTNDASANNTLTAGISAGKIVWSDGYTSLITVVDSLPLTGKTLTF